MIIIEHPHKKWEVSIIELEEDGKTVFKVTRHLAELAVAETKVFHSKQEAKKQFEDWLE